MDTTNFHTIKPADLPSPPQTAIRIMRACSRKRVNNEELSSLTQNDPLLTAELLRIANSSFFSHGRSVESISRAIQVLGQRALRNLALCLSVRDALKDCVIPGFDLDLFWEDGLRRAVSARLLGRLASLDADECFTAGLLQDFGLLVLFHLFPEKGNEAVEMRKMTPSRRRNREKAIFCITHDRVVEQLAEEWQLPENLSLALGSHHKKKDEGQARSPLSRVLQGADWLNALFTVDNKKVVLSRCNMLFFKGFGLDRQKTEEYIASIPSQTEEAADALGLRIGEQEDFSDVLRSANLRLIEDNVSYQELAWRLKKTLLERDRLASELRKELKLAREVQKSLLPVSREGLPVHGINISARHLSGDFYDYFSLPDGRIIFNLGDVSGKGSHAALLMAKISSVFRCLGRVTNSPGELLERINSELCATSIRGMFVTMVAGIYSPVAGIISLANAGHPPPLLVNRNGHFKEFPAEEPPLGILPGQKFREQNVELGNGSLYIYSDGITEGRDSENQPLGIKGLLDLIKRHGNLPRQKRLVEIVKPLRERPLKDDITLLVVEMPDG
ncbi:MAG: HDOD domain-containing protein [Desulfobulbaceae bacterium]|nr:HDOD domain-containing protein [Desulfobulbaceae bacterium]